MTAVRSSTDSSKSQPTYPQVICSVAVAQICLTAGYRGGQTAALRVLTDVAGRYIRFLADAAASAANTHGRTQCNILDLVVALELAAAGRGFAGASNVPRAILRSSVLRELQAFVAAVDEIPFPRSIPRRKETGAERKSTRSFAQAGREPPMTHVPRWLPCFPEGYDKGGDIPSNNADEKIEQKETSAMAMSMAVIGRDMTRERARVRFRLAFGGKKKKKKVGIGNFIAISDEQDVQVEEIAALKNSCRRRVSN